MWRPSQLIPNSLSGQFALAGGLVMALAASVVGSWVSDRIEQGVVQNSGVAAALFMESFISPLSQELADDNGLSEPARAALKEVFTATALGERVVSYKIWREDGEVVEASDPNLRGKRFEPTDDLITAWGGKISATFEELDGTEDAGEAALGLPLLEVYSPIREIWTGEVIAVAEFYEHAEGLARELQDATRQSWLIVLAIFATSGFVLFGIVQAGSRLIEQQRGALKSQLAESRRMSAQNAELKDRVMAAAQRSTAQADRVMQRIGQDLHDGVAQHLSLASLRFEEARPSDPETSDTVRRALDAAMTELRAISRGLALPDIDRLGLAASVTRAVEDHRRAFRATIEAENRIGDEVNAAYPIKLCAYRFVQEALSNATRHAGAGQVFVHATRDAERVEITVQDDGRGFDPDSTSDVRLDGGQGLHGLRDRAETLNGRVQIVSRPGQGTTLKLTLPIRGPRA